MRHGSTPAATSSIRDLLAFDTYAHTSQRESKASDGAFEVTNKEEARWQERRDDRRGEAR